MQQSKCVIHSVEAIHKVFIGSRPGVVIQSSPLYSSVFDYCVLKTILVDRCHASP